VNVSKQSGIIRKDDKGINEKHVGKGIEKEKRRKGEKEKRRKGEKE